MKNILEIFISINCVSITLTCTIYVVIVSRKENICIWDVVWVFWPWYEEHRGNSCAALLLGFDALLSESPYFSCMATAQSNLLITVADKKKNNLSISWPAHSSPAPTSLCFYEAMNKRGTRWCRGLLRWDVLVNEQLWICRTLARDPGPQGLSLGAEPFSHFLYLICAKG